MERDEADRDTRQDRAVIGSAASCDIRVTEPKVSRRHCAVSKGQDGFFIEDLGSRNGVYANGERIDRKVAVEVGAAVTLGRSIPFPWDDIVAFFEHRNDDDQAPRRFLTIGRLEGNDLVLPDPTVSGRHAQIVIEAAEVFIEDLGSRNGTFLNDSKTGIARALLRPHDTIRLGDSVLPARVFFPNQDDDNGSVSHPEDDGLKTALGDGPAIPHGALDLTGRRGTFVLGRSPDCDFQIDYPMVSLRHAQVTLTGSKTSIADLGSSNGTFVNGVRITRQAAVEPGDMIALGSVWFILSDDGRSLAPRASRGDITIEARGVGVTVADNKRILDRINLAIHPGELVGLMGPSGAGKSTLIAVLNGYLPPTSGTVMINRRDLYDHFDEFRGMVGYVPQDDIMHPDLTVSEALYYSARLRLPTDYSDAEIHARIEKILASLGLQGTEHTRVGNAERRGISGGQRKRVNVAMELLTDPPLLFLDEPTSGLSSEDALSLMRLLRQLADGGKTVVLTIHQPSLDVYRLMDNLIVVGKDSAPPTPGRLAYYGPAYPDAIAFFAPESAPSASPDAVLRGLATRPIREWAKLYADSPHHRRFVHNRLERRSKYVRKPLRRKRTAGGTSQYFTLVRRGLAVKLKDTWNTGVLLIQAPLIALLIGLVFGPKLSSQVTLDNYPGVATATATTMFLLGVSALWFGSSNSAREIVAESAIYRRERMVGLGIPSYIAAKVTVLALLCLFQCGVLLVVVGWLGSIAASWMALYSSLFMASLVGVSIGLAISGLAKTSDVAAGVLPLVILPMVILGGILLPLHELPRTPIPMRALASAMPSRWAFESLLMPEAFARVGLDPTTAPPRLVSARENQEPMGSGRKDMAEAFFPVADRWSAGMGFPFFVLMIQAVFLFVVVGLVLLTKDVT